MSKNEQKATEKNKVFAAVSHNENSFSSGELNALMSLTGKVIYRYNVKSRKAILLAGKDTDSEARDIIENYPEENIKNGFIAEESADEWRKIFRSIERGQKHGSALLTFNTAKKDTGRCLLNFSITQTEKTEPVLALFTFEDITEKHENLRRQTLEREGLLHVTRQAFPEILCVNVTKETYRIIQYYGETTLGTPIEGALDSMLKPRLKHVYPEDREDFKKIFSAENLRSELKQGRDKLQLSYRRSGHDGVWHWMETIAMKLENPYDDDMLVIAVSRNIDKQKKEEAKLNRAFEITSGKLADRLYYEHLSDEVIPGLIYISYLDGSSSPYISGSLAKKLGCSPDDVALCRGSVIHPDDAESLADARLDAEKKNFFNADYRVLNGEGEYSWIHNEISVFTDKNGREGHIHLLTDVTEEHNLRETLQIHAEESRLIMEQLGKIVCFYDARERTMTMPKQNAQRYGLPEILNDFPACLSKDVGIELDESSLRKINEYYNAIHRGERSGETEYSFTDSHGKKRWMRLSFHNIFDSEGEPMRAVVFVENVTKEHLKDEENSELKKNAQMLRIVARHSNRLMCYYDIQRRKFVSWNEDNCDLCPLPGICKNSFSEKNIRNSDVVLPESVESMLAMFRNIHEGESTGKANLRLMTVDDEKRWFDFKYSTVFENGMPAAAIVTFRDITDRYDHELSYRRFMQTIDKDIGYNLSYMECDLTANKTERIDDKGFWLDNIPEGKSYSDFCEEYLSMLTDEKGKSAAGYFSKENLIYHYQGGNKKLAETWTLQTNAKGRMFVKIKIDLVEDPYTKHIKAFFRVTDKTSVRKESQILQTRAEKDGMTGLLNRATGEERIRRIMSERDGTGGILVLLDLDDLKTINDDMGHEQGDRAIKSFAETIKSHFRQNDIIMRAGGDEFMVYLSGAGKNKSSVSIAMSTFMRKLSGLPIGANDEKRIHCSAGCAVEFEDGDDFDSLYRRADLALYHVKRNGKNNFAFFENAMYKEDYEFKKSREEMHVRKSISEEEIDHFMEAISSFYPLVLSVDLTNDRYQMLEGDNKILPDLPVADTLDVLKKEASKMVHPADMRTLNKEFSRNSLLLAYAEGKTNKRFHFRFGESRKSFIWAEGTFIFYTTKSGDICAFAFFRRDIARADELELLRLQKIMEIAITASFEYICLINIRSGRYTLYGKNGKNVLNIPETADFNTVIQQIRDTQIRPEDRETYYKAAALENVVSGMEAAGGKYRYRYTLADGEREASFSWYEKSHSELLMTVRKTTKKDDKTEK